MKRLRRNPEQHEVLSLYAALARVHGYKLDRDKDAADFVSRIKASFESSKNNPNMLHGKRIEDLFAYVAGGLGNASIVKHEDAGDVFAQDDALNIPDYRIILKTGDHFLVEVKNCNSMSYSKPYSLSKRYVEKMQRYAEMNRTTLKIAIYFSRFGRWVLLPINAFDESNGKYSTTFIEAIGRSEMSLLGDRTIGTAPELEFVMETGDYDAQVIDDSGRATFVIRSIRMFCNESEITSDAEKHLAFYLMRFGDWPEKENEAIIREGRLHGIRIAFAPEQPNPDQNFQMIGTFSTMITNAFKEYTVTERRLVALNASVDPKDFQISLSSDYKGVALPIWQFEVQANPQFKFSG